MDYRTLADQIADEEGVPRELARALITQESAWNPRAMSSAGAYGMTQLMPGTAAEMGVTDLEDPAQQLRGGIRYLKQGLDKYGDVENALRFYHGGPNQANWGARTNAYPGQVLRHLPGLSDKPAAASNDGWKDITDKVISRPESSDGWRDITREVIAGWGPETTTPTVEPKATLGGMARTLGASAVDAFGNLFQGGGEAGAAALNALTGSEFFRAENPLKPVSDAIRDGMSPGDKMSVKDTIKGDAFDPSSYEFPKTAGGWGHAIAQGLGSLSTALIPAGMAVTGARGAVAMGSAVGGLTTAGGAASDIRENFSKLTPEAWETIPAYREARAAGLDEVEAKQRVENRSAQIGGLLSGAAGAVGGAFNTRFLEDLVAKKGMAKVLGNLSDSAWKRAVAGGTAGVVTEATQEGLEKWGQNVGENIGRGDPTFQDATRDTLGDVVLGGLVGGITGGTGGAISRNQPTVVDIPPAPPAERPQLPPPGGLSGPRIVGSDGNVFESEAQRQQYFSGADLDLTQPGAYEELIRRRSQIEGDLPDPVSVVAGQQTAAPSVEDDQANAMIDGWKRDGEPKRVFGPKPPSGDMNDASFDRMKMAWAELRDSRAADALGEQNDRAIELEHALGEIVTNPRSLFPYPTEGAAMLAQRSLSKERGPLEVISHPFKSGAFAVVRPDVAQVIDLSQRLGEQDMAEAKVAQKAAQKAISNPQATQPTADTVPMLPPPAAPIVERRADAANRKRVSELTEEEAKRELLTNAKTGIPNRRAFDEEADSHKSVASLDVKSFKWYNDTFSHAEGDIILKASASILQAAADEVGARAYHFQGDEFAIGAQDKRQVTDALQRAGDMMKNAVFQFTRQDGSVFEVRGVEFAHGIDTTYDRADARSNAQRAEAIAAGTEPPRGSVPQRVRQLSPARNAVDGSPAAQRGGDQVDEPRGIGVSGSARASRDGVAEQGGGEHRGVRAERVPLSENAGTAQDGTAQEIQRGSYATSETSPRGPSTIEGSQDRGTPPPAVNATPSQQAPAPAGVSVSGSSSFPGKDLRGDANVSETNPRGDAAQGEPLPEGRADNGTRSDGTGVPDSQVGTAPTAGAVPAPQAEPSRRTGQGKSPAAEPGARSGLIFAKDNKPYLTERAAKLAIRGRRLEGYAPIIVEGGWALQDRVKAREEHYAPGNIIKDHYSKTFDRVLAYDKGTNGRWFVVVEKVERNEGGWKPVERERIHSTQPDARDVVVERNTAGESDLLLSRMTWSKKIPIGDFDVSVDKSGAMLVWGDPKEIRALLPENVKGRATLDGLAFTSSDAARVRAALEGSKIAYSRRGEVTEKLERKADGTYLGAPEKFNTPAKIPGLRKLLKQLALEGEAGRYWYERSSEAILRMTGGDINEARKFVALLAIYSPQAKVDVNSTFALRAWAQYKAGQPINVKTAVMDDKAQAAMDNIDEFWSGEKTGNFFTNLLVGIDPSLEGKQGATIDMWMMRAGQYDNDAPTKTQYAFMENETNRLAQELGWEPQQVQAAIWVAMKARMENAGVKKSVEAKSERRGWIRFDYPEKNGRPTKTRVILDAQRHRDNWLEQAMAHEPTATDTGGAKFDFSDGVRRHVGQVSWEARPGRSTGVLPGVNDAPFAQQVRFQQDVQKALLGENGEDLLAQRLGLLTEGDLLAPGVWQSEVAAGMQKQVAMAPAKGDDGKTGLDAAQKKLLDLYSATLGLLLRQEGVGWHRPFYTGTRTQENGVELRIGRPMEPAEAKALWFAIDQRMREAGNPDWEMSAGMISSPAGMRVVNFGALEDNGIFRKLVADAYRDATAITATAEVVSFTSDGNLVTNDWKENPNGQHFQNVLRAAGRSDVLQWAADVLAPRVQAVFERYSEEHGWGDPGKPLQASPASRKARSKVAEDGAPDDSRGESGIPLFSREGPPPPFYSQMARVIGDLMGNSEPAPQLLLKVQGWVKSGKFKADELEWSGLTDWLKMQDGRVSKADVLAFLDTNGVQVREVLKGSGSATRFAQYRFPGGTKYREMLLTLSRAGDPAPPRITDEYIAEWIESHHGMSVDEYAGPDWRMRQTRRELVDEIMSEEQEEPAGPPGAYKGPHWKEPDVLAHVRMTDRTDADGKRVLFVEEVQSDWAQQGRKKGFSTPEGVGDDAVPRGPFVENTTAWVSLAVKRILTFAAQNGYDKVAFITGEQSADRYSLDRQLDSLDVTRAANGTYRVVGKRGRDAEIDKDGLTASKLSDTIGKEMAQKAIDSINEKVESETAAGATSFRGLDLKVGGQGMRDFYGDADGRVTDDKGRIAEDRKTGRPKVPFLQNVVNDIAKKVGGGRMEVVQLRTRKKEGLAQPGLTITPAVREKLAGGMPLFARGAGAGITRVDLQAVVGAITKGWLNAPKIHVLDHVDQAPKKLLDQMRAVGADEIARGAFYEGEVYLFANNIADPMMAEHVLLHETRHYGMEGRYGQELKSVLMGLYLKNANLREDVAAIRAQYPDLSIVNAVNEILADKPLDYAKQLSGWDRFKIAVKNLLEKLGFTRLAGAIETAEGDAILRDFLHGAEQYAKKAAPKGTRYFTGTQFDAPLYSRDYAKAARDHLSDLVGTQKIFNLWDRTIGTQLEKARKSPAFKRVFDAANRFMDDVSTFGNAAADQAPDLLPKMETLKETLTKFGANKKDQEAVAKAVFAGTLAGETVLDGKRWSDAELKAQGLTDKQIGYYRQARAAIDRSLDDLAASEATRTIRTTLDIPADVVAKARAGNAAEVYDAFLKKQPANPAIDKLRADIAGKFEHIAKLKAAGYAPLMRFGRYTVTVGEGDETLYFATFETEREANAMARAFKEDPEYKNATIEQGIMAQEAWKVFKGISPDTLEIFAEALDADESAVFQSYLKLAVNNRSAMKRMIQRKGTAGFSEDVTRVLASFITSNARAASRNYNSTEMRRAVSEIDKRQGDVKDEALRYVEYLENPQDEAGALRGFMFFNYLGGSMASALVNMTQPLMMTLPWLSQHGNASSALLNALRGPQNDDAKAALARAERDGVVSPQEIHNLTAESIRSFGSNQTVRRAMRIWGSFFAVAEQFNRRVTFLAAYEVGKAQKMADPFKFAEQAVRETQGVYSKVNRPNWGRGALGGTLLTFKQFSIAYVEFLKNLPNKQRALALALLVLAAGIQGLPFADDLEDVIDTIAQGMGYSFNSKQALRKWAVATLGKEGGAFLMNGVSTLLPLDFAGRMSLGNLIPGTSLLKRSEENKGREAAEVLGPVGGLVKSAGDAATALMDGELAKAGRAFAPVAIQNAMKAYDMQQRGMYRDTKGRKVVDTDDTDAAIKAIGFQPTKVAAESRLMQESRQTIALNKAVEKDISDLLAQGFFEHDQEKVQKAREQLKEWNADNPESPIAITIAQIQRRVKEMMMTREQRFIKTAPKEIRGTMLRDLRQ